MCKIDLSQENCGKDEISVDRPKKKFSFVPKYAATAQCDHHGEERFFTFSEEILV